MCAMHEALKHGALRHSSNLQPALATSTSQHNSLHAVPAAPEHKALPHHQPPPADSSMELQPLPHETDGFGPSSFAAGRREDHASPKIPAQGSNAAALGGLLPTNSKIPLSKQTSLTQGHSAGQGQQYGRPTLEVHTDDEAIQFADEDGADEDTGLISRTPRPQVTPLHGCCWGRSSADAACFCAAAWLLLSRTQRQHVTPGHDTGMLPTCILL